MKKRKSKREMERHLCYKHTMMMMMCGNKIIKKYLSLHHSDATNDFQ